MKVFAARWYLGFRIGKASLWVGWVNQRTAANYNALLERHGVEL